MKYVHVWAIPDDVSTEQARDEAIEQVRTIGIEHGHHFHPRARLVFLDGTPDPIPGPDGEPWYGPVLVAICEVDQC